MNKQILFPLFTLVLPLFIACQPRTEVQPDAKQADTTAVKAAETTPSRRQTSIYSPPYKGRIEVVSEIPVYSRIAEQIVMFAVEYLGQYVEKGQVVARLSDTALRDKILHCQAKLEKAEFQYQAILMGQGYKHDRLDEAPEDLKRLARINSGYNETKAELRLLEHQLEYCTIKAPVSGFVQKIQNTLYGQAKPGEPLFYIVDVDNLKVKFDVLENELAKYKKGIDISVTTVCFPSEHHSATISGCTPVIDSNGMIQVEATLKPHPHLYPGMTAFVTITTH